MVLKDQVTKCLQRAFHSSNLHQDIPAIAVVFQHLPNAVELPNHPLQTVLQLAQFLVPAGCRFIMATACSGFIGRL